MLSRVAVTLSRRAPHAIRYGRGIALTTTVRASSALSSSSFRARAYRPSSSLSVASLHVTPPLSRSSSSSSESRPSSRPSMSRTSLPPRSRVTIIGRSSAPFAPVFASSLSTWKLPPVVPDIPKPDLNAVPPIQPPLSTTTGSSTATTSSSIPPSAADVASSSASDAAAVAAPKVGKIREMFNKYGIVAFGTYFGVYFSTLGMLYVAVSRQWINVGDVTVLLNKIGLEQMAKDLNPKASAFAIAWILTKFTEPLRAIFTIAVTPKLAQLLGRVPKPLKRVNNVNEATPPLPK